MFKIVSQPKAWWPVKFAGVTDDGKVVQNEFELRFIILDEDANQDLEISISEAADTLVGEGRIKPSQFAANVVMKMAEDWKGVTLDDGTEAGKSLPFSPENLQMLLKTPNVFLAVAAAYRDCRAGTQERRRGN